MRNFGLILILIFLYKAGLAQPEVKNFGSLRQIMHENDTSEKVRLNLMGPLNNVYGLGAVSSLNGEILILNGETYVTRVYKNSLATDKSTDVGAALLVLSEVQEWDTLVLTRDISSLRELDKYLEALSFQNKPLPFLILSDSSIINWHVIQTPESAEQMQNHKELGLNGKYTGTSLMLGFFSTTHEGVFTHKGQNTHIHFQSDDKLYAGHVDELALKKDDKLLVPVY